MTTQLLERPVTRVRKPLATEDLVALLVLREVDGSGPLTGLETVNRVAPLARLVGAAQPGYRLLHDLVDEGLLAVRGELPPEYSATDAGRAAADLLAARLWPQIYPRLMRVGARIAPDGADALTFVVPWMDERTMRPRPERPPPASS